MAESCILIDSFGCRSLVPATQAAAVEIYREHRDDIRRACAQHFPSLGKPMNGGLFRPDGMVRALNDALSLPVGSSSQELRWLLHGARPKNVSFDNRPPVFVQEAWKVELLLQLAPFIFQPHISYRDWRSLLTSRILDGWHPEVELSFLAGTRWAAIGQKGITWLHGDTLDNVKTAYRVETALASDEPVSMSDILSLCNQFSHRDVRYELVKLEATQ